MGCKKGEADRFPLLLVCRLYLGIADDWSCLRSSVYFYKMPILSGAACSFLCAGHEKSIKRMHDV